MKPGLSLILVLSCACSAGVSAQTAAEAPITANPVPAPVEKRGIAVAIHDLVRLPDTRSAFQVQGGACSARSGRDHDPEISDHHPETGDHDPEIADHDPETAP